MPQPVIVPPRLQPPPVGQTDAQAGATDLLDPPPLTIHHPETLEIAGEDDLLARAQVNGAGLEDRNVMRGIARGFEPAGHPAPFQRDPVLATARHPPRLAFPASVDIPIGNHDIARAIAQGVSGQAPGQATVHEPFDPERGAGKLPVLGQPFAQGGVDLFPLGMGGREDHRPLPRLRGQRQPEPGRCFRQPVRGNLPHVAAEALDGEVRIPGNHMGDGSLEVRPALPQHIVHPRRLHARVLHQAERLPRLDRAQLQPVAHKCEPGNPEPLCHPLQIAHLHRADHRRLVHHDHRPPEPCAGRLMPRRIFRAVGQMPVARQHPLQRGRANPRFQRQNTGRRRGRGQPDHRAAPRKPDDLFQHVGLAGAREALNPDDPALRQQDSPNRIPLPLRQRRGLKSCGDVLFFGQRCAASQPLPQGGNHAAFRPEGLACGQITPHRVHQMPVPAQPVDGHLKLFMPMPSGVSPQCGGQQVGAPED